MTTQRDIRNQIAYARKEGVAEGKIEVARNLLRLGMTSEQICLATGLSEEQIQQL